MLSTLPVLFVVVIGNGDIDLSISSMFKLCFETGTNVERFIGSLIELFGDDNIFEISPFEELEYVVFGSIACLRIE